MVVINCFGKTGISILFLIIISLSIEINSSQADEGPGPVYGQASFQGLEPLVIESALLPAPGQPLLLQFWASWCHSCSGIMWDMDELIPAGNELSYLAVSLDEKPVDARNYIEKHGLFAKYQTQYFFDPGKVFANSLQVETVPAILLLDREGNVVIQKAGHLNSSDMQDLNRSIKQLLAENSVSNAEKPNDRVTRDQTAE